MEARVGATSVDKAVAALAQDQGKAEQGEPLDPAAVAAELGGSVVGECVLTDDDKWLNPATGQVYDHLPAQQ